jgi:hypothetical protein
VEEAWQLYEHFFYRLLERVLFDWPRSDVQGRHHTVSESWTMNEGNLPAFAVITEGKVADVTVAQRLSFEPGTVVVDDRGYNDEGLFARCPPQASLVSPA